jgi:uncharacterized protein YodC (DUF2158 family)
VKTVLEPGDVVHLKCGGPPMTISVLSEDGKMAQVRWWSGSGLMYKDAIPVAALVHESLLKQRKRK